jgi:tripartite-type tricarboxylate transporter receptor subunit TctC
MSAISMVSKSRVFRMVLVFFLILFGAFGTALAYPEKNITLVVPVAPGGAFDVTSRIFATYFPKYLPKPTTVVVVNMPGGSWSVGIREVYKAKPDGYTMGIFHPTANVANQITGKADFDLEKISWLGSLSESNPISVVPTKSKYKTFQDLKAAAKIKAAVVGVGIDTDTLICAKTFGFNITQIPYNGSTEAILSMVRGETDWSQFPYAALKTSIQDSKELTPLWVYAARRLPQLPDVPTIKEMGYESLLSIVTQYRPIGLPPGVPPDTLKVLRDAFEKTLKDPDFIQKLRSANLAGNTASAEEVQKIVKEAIVQFTKFKELFN